MKNQTQNMEISPGGKYLLSQCKDLKKYKRYCISCVKKYFNQDGYVEYHPDPKEYFYYVSQVFEWIESFNSEEAYKRNGYKDSNGGGKCPHFPYSHKKAMWSFVNAITEMDKEFCYYFKDLDDRILNQVLMRVKSSAEDLLCEC